MGNKHTTAKLTRRDSDIAVSEHETDSPILPVLQLEQLNQFKPDAVDWAWACGPIASSLSDFPDSMLIVTTDTVQAANDKQQVETMIEKLKIWFMK